MLNPNIKDFFSEWPFIIQLVWIIGLLLVFIISIQIIVLFILRRSLRIKEKKEKRYKSESETLVISYLYSSSEEEQKPLFDKIKKYISHKLKRESILEVLLKLQRDITGDMSTQLKKLYADLNLLDYSLKKIKSNSWYITAKVIKELRLMKVEGLEKEFEALLNHDKDEVRKEVQLYYVEINGFNGLRFLDKLDQPLSEWQQLQLLGILNEITTQNLPDISSWLVSKNATVVIFALKLAKIYNQFHLKTQLLKLLEHPNKNIRINTIKVMKHLGVIESKAFLKEHFIKMDTEEQLVSIQTITDFSTKEDYPFLLEQTKNKIFDIRYIAVNSLKRILNKTEFDAFFKIPENKQNSMINFIQNQ